MVHVSARETTHFLSMLELLLTQRARTIIPIIQMWHHFIGLRGCSGFASPWRRRGRDLHLLRRRCLLLLPPRPSLCVMLPVGGNCLGPKTNGLCHTLHWVHWKWSSVRKRVGRRSRPSCSQRTNWKKVPHVVWAKDTRGSLAHTIDVSRRTDILHRFRLQWCSEAWTCGSHLRTIISARWMSTIVRVVDNPRGSIGVVPPPTGGMVIASPRLAGSWTA